MPPASAVLGGLVQLVDIGACGCFEVRYVNANGGIRWSHLGQCLHRLCREYVDLEEIDDGIWNVYFSALKIGRLLSDACVSRMLMAAA